jgi:pimeloyl-ACP methyl ester carboxylesterase
MGGATGILAVAGGAQVQGLVSIGAPGDLWEVWSYHLDRKGMPGRWIVRGLSPFWSYRAGESWADLDPRRRAPDVGVPFLILHGEDDQSVPPDHAWVLAEAAGVEARVLPGLGHTDLLEDPETHAPLVEFLLSLPGVPQR